MPTPEVDVCGGEVVDVFVVALMVVVIDERLGLRFQICWKEVVLQQDAVLQGLVPSLAGAKITLADPRIKSLMFELQPLNSKQMIMEVEELGFNLVSVVTTNHFFVPTVR